MKTMLLPLVLLALLGTHAGAACNQDSTARVQTPPPAPCLGQSAADYLSTDNPLRAD